MSTKHILIVEDEPTLMEIYLLNIEDRYGKDVVVITATSVKEGLDASRNIQFDAVISDYLLPDGVGTSVTNFIKGLCDSNPGIVRPFVALVSGAPPFATGQEALNNGIDMVFEKPVNFDDLITRISQEMDRQNAAA